jgi:hypothetical protein
MATVVDKIQDLEYNELVTLGVIEQNDDLLDVFKSEVKMPINLLYKFQKDGNLNDETKKVLRDFFDKLILTKQAFINQYLKLAGLEPSDVKQAVADEILKVREDVIPIAEPNTVVTLPADKYKNPSSVLTKVEETTEKPKTKVVKEKEIPRRYGKQEIEKAIIAQGFKATPKQRAGLKLNNLKNLNQVLVNKFIKDTFTENQVLTDEDYIKIEASITMFERSLDAILKKK